MSETLNREAKINVKNKILLRSISDSDADVMYKWLNDRAVLEFYEGRDNPFTLKMVKDKFFNAEDNVSRYIIMYDDKAVGYMQSYPLSQNECRDEYEYTCQKSEMPVYGIDLFIGEPQFWSQGIGREALRLLCDTLVYEHGVKTFLIDPHTDNKRAIKCYEHASFLPVKVLKEHEKHEGKMCDCLLMKYTV